MMATGGRRIAIVGAGYAGTVVAINLLRRAVQPLHIVLIERSGTIGRGVAYARRDFPYMLNVPASHMSATSSDPDEFLRFAQQHLPDVRGEDFVSRALYGDYLAQLLQTATAAARPDVTVTFHTGCVVDLANLPAPEICFADNSRLAVHDVVLALGNPLPADPCPAPGLAGLPGVRSEPWTRIADADPTRALLIIGSGLTMADVVCQTVARTPRRPIHVLSRHGLVPPEQTNFERTPVTVATHPLTPSPSLRHLVSAARALTRQIELLGGDWRTAVTTIRHAAPALWRGLPSAERRRFLRHVRSYWDVHRHRLPESVRARIAALHATGQLKLHAGRLQGVATADGELLVRWRPRGQVLEQELRVGEIANCTGPDYDLARSSEPLWRALVGRGAARTDELGLGIRTAAHGALIDASGGIHQHLYYLGPMLRADHWEVTAAAELREHAEALAQHLLAREPAPQ